MEQDKNKRLTYEELVKVCSLLGIYLEHLNEVVEFLISEMLGVKAEVYRYNKKTPYKRLDELEALIKGMNSYYQEKLAEFSQRKTKVHKY